MAGGADGYINMDMATFSKHRERNGYEAQFANRIHINADGTEATIDITGTGRRKRRIDIRTREGRRLLQELVEQMRAAAYYERPVESFFKPEKPAAPTINPRAEYPCPQCQAELPTCWFCHGEGYVTGRQILELDEDGGEA